MISIGHLDTKVVLPFYLKLMSTVEKITQLHQSVAKKSLQAMTNVKNINVLAGQMKTLQAGCEYFFSCARKLVFHKRRLGSVGYTPNILTIYKYTVKLPIYK